MYFNFVPIKKGVALIGFVNKYNAPNTIFSSKVRKNKIELHLINGESKNVLKPECDGEMSVETRGGTFIAILPSRPVSVTVNDFPVKDFIYENGVLMTPIHFTSLRKETVLIIKLK